MAVNKQLPTIHIFYLRDLLEQVDQRKQDIPND